MDNCVIKPSPGKGNGLFATKNIAANNIIFEFVGKPITKAEAAKLPSTDSACLLQVGADLYLDLRRHYSIFANHSCNPNCFVRIAVNRAFLVALRDIKIGDELVYDYSATSTDLPSEWALNCNCHLFRCRKVISGFSSLPKEVQDKYIKLGAVPAYVQNQKT